MVELEKLGAVSNTQQNYLSDVAENNGSKRKAEDLFYAGKFVASM